MIAKIIKFGKTALLTLLALAFLAGCSDDDDGAMYSVTTTNITNNQPLSPMAVVVHVDGYTGWDEGNSASSGLEMLAEGGSTTDFLAEANGNANIISTDSGSGLILPGASDTVMVMAGSSRLRLTTASMLVNTNDAFTGVNGMLIGDLVVGESRTFFAMTLDSGTEANSETAATIPGPAGGGEGYNAARDDSDFVSVHGGVVTIDDGLSTSALDESHRFIGPAAKIVVTRIK
jgi:hypothetical protein